MDDDEPMTMPSTAAGALAEELGRCGRDLDSLDLATVAEALGRVRRASDALREALHDRGWGTGLDEWAAFDELTGDDVADVDDLLEDDVEEDDEPLEGARYSWQARYDFVVTDPEALLARARARSLEVDPDVDPDEALAEHGGPLGLLLLLDGPQFRDYDEHGAVMAYGTDTFAEVDRTLDEIARDAGEQTYPLA
ncbi:hypothetical protein WDV85_12265 [Pseudokineococcus sp. 5B2Z-1]|uniref:hypothetical protein n=1 Tax=Pseudokineococcus sp. 5B2Z-1 TaxID=3132744 RepID=UPI0030990069